MNSTQLIGRHSKDPDLRYTSNGTAVCNFTLAVRNPFRKNDDGSAGVDFIQCVAWGNAGELVANNHRTGNMMGVEGRIEVRTYDKDDGQRVWVTEVNCNQIHLIDTYNRDGDNGDNSNNGSGNNGNNGNSGNRNRGNGNGNGNSRGSGNNNRGGNGNGNGNRGNGSGNGNRR